MKCPQQSPIPPLNTTLRALVRHLVEQGIDALRANGTLPAGLETPGFVVEPQPSERISVRSGKSCSIALTELAE